MIVKLLKQLIVPAVVVLLCTITVSAQTSSIFWLKINDSAGGHDSLVFGIHMSATYGVDGAIGENSSPPDPPGFFAKFISIESRDNPWGLGLIKKDLRNFESAAKEDTFLLYVKNDDSLASQVAGVTQTFAWPDSAWLARRCDSIFFEYTFVNRSFVVTQGRINMFSQSSKTFTDLYKRTGPNGLSAPTLNVSISKYGTRNWPPPGPDAVRKDKEWIPSGYSLHQNYPNPFNPTTTLQFDILRQGQTDISIFNMLGQKVSTLVSRELTPGTFSVTWDGTNDLGVPVTSGVYLARMAAHSSGQGADFSAVRKLVLMK